MVVFTEKELLEKAVKLHGHLGPFLVLGLKMGLKAKEILGEKLERCTVKTVKRKPYLCAVDGIKTIMESEDIFVQEDRGLGARFTGANGQEVEVKIKDDLIEKYAEVPWEKCEEYANEVTQSDDEDLFQ
jgi:hypothetical protein